MALLDARPDLTQSLQSAFAEVRDRPFGAGNGFRQVNPGVDPSEAGETIRKYRRIEAKTC